MTTCKGEASRSSATTPNRILSSTGAHPFYPEHRLECSTHNAPGCRTEFLMNRILKTQEAAPPWIELQKGAKCHVANRQYGTTSLTSFCTHAISAELDAALSAFRTELRANWTRRAIRIRSTEGLTGAVVREVRDGWTDPEWIAREK